MDYEALLKKYMTHVLQTEGVTFVEHIGGPWPGSDVAFTPEELLALKAIEASVNPEPRKG